MQVLQNYNSQSWEKFLSYKSVLKLSKYVIYNCYHDTLQKLLINKNIKLVKKCIYTSLFSDYE